VLDQSLAARYADGLIDRHAAVERAQDPREFAELIRTVDSKRQAR